MDVATLEVQSLPALVAPASKLHCTGGDVTLCSMFMKEYDSYSGEAFDIREDRTYRFRNCRIGFTCLWVLFMVLLVLYFRLLHGIGKSASLFSSISL